MIVISSPDPIACTTIKELKYHFARHGISYAVISDIELQFSAKELETFAFN